MISASRDVAYWCLRGKTFQKVAEVLIDVQT